MKTISVMRIITSTTSMQNLWGALYFQSSPFSFMFESFSFTLVQSTSLVSEVILSVVWFISYPAALAFCSQLSSPSVTYMIFPSIILSFYRHLYRACFYYSVIQEFPMFLLEVGLVGLTLSSRVIALASVMVSMRLSDLCCSCADISRFLSSLNWFMRLSYILVLCQISSCYDFRPAYLIYAIWPLIFLSILSIVSSRLLRSKSIRTASAPLFWARAEMSQRM